LPSRTAAPELRPSSLERRQLSAVNAFSFWSRKLRRRVLVVGPSQFDAVLLLEFDPDVTAYCERPDLRLDLLPWGSSRFRTLDFWVRRRNGRQNGVIVAESNKVLSEELLRRSLAEAKLGWEIWLANDLLQRRQFIRNLKQLRPYVSSRDDTPSRAKEHINSFLSKFREGRWDQIQAATPGVAPSVFARVLARMYHAGEVALEIDSAPLSIRTWVRTP